MTRKPISMFTVVGFETNTSFLQSKLSTTKLHLHLWGVGNTTDQLKVLSTPEILQHQIKDHIKSNENPVFKSSRVKENMCLKSTGHYSK